VLGRSEATKSITSTIEEYRIIMKKHLRFLALFMVPALAIGLSTLLAACGSDDEGGGDDVAAVFQSADPASGSIPKDSIIRLTFDKDPGTLTASAGTVGGAGAARTVTAGAESITLTWDNGGTTTLTYTLTAPDTTAPTLTSSSPADGDADVDPAAVNGSGIVIEFDEDIARTAIEVQADGAKIGNWPAERDGGKVTMNPAAGAELVNETQYTVVGTVEDAAGNESDVSITFTTAAKQ
jgi:hypothetical protein